MRVFVLGILLNLIFLIYNNLCAQDIRTDYTPPQSDSIRVGKSPADYMPFISRGYTLMIPDIEGIKAVLILLEDSQFDHKNKNAKSLYALAQEKGYAVLSVSSEIPLDFFFTTESCLSVHQLIQEVFKKYSLPNNNVFFLGGSLVGHRAMRYIKFINENKLTFQLNIKGLVLCHFTLDWTRKWHQHKRDIEKGHIDQWEPTFMNYMLESHLNGTPETASENYHDFSAYSQRDNRNIELYKSYSILAYTKPDIQYRLDKQLRTLQDNNMTDIVGFLSELKLTGNHNTKLVTLASDYNPDKNIKPKSCWNAIDKKEIIQWIEGEIKNR